MYRREREIALLPPLDKFNTIVYTRGSPLIRHPPLRWLWSFTPQTQINVLETCMHYVMPIRIRLFMLPLNPAPIVAHSSFTDSAHARTSDISPSI